MKSLICAIFVLLLSVSAFAASPTPTPTPAALPAAVSSIAAPIIAATPGPTPVPLLFAIKDNTTGIGPITGMATVAMGDSLTLAVSGPSTPLSVTVTVNGASISSVGVSASALNQITMGGIVFRKLGTMTADQTGEYDITVSASGFVANSLVIQAQ